MADPLLSSGVRVAERSLSVLTVLMTLARLEKAGIASASRVGVFGLDVEFVGVKREGFESPLGDFFFRRSVLVVLPVVLLLQRLSLPNFSSASSVGVVLRDDERECERSLMRSLTTLGRLFLSLG